MLVWGNVHVFGHSRRLCLSVCTYACIQAGWFLTFSPIHHLCKEISLWFGLLLANLFTQVMSRGFGLGMTSFLHEHCVHMQNLVDLKPYVNFGTSLRTWWHHTAKNCEHANVHILTNRDVCVTAGRPCRRSTAVTPCCIHPHTRGCFVLGHASIHYAQANSGGDQIQRSARFPLGK